MPSRCAARSRKGSQSLQDPATVLQVPIHWSCFLSCQLRGRSSIVHGRARRASRTIRRIKTMLAGCESVRKNPENRTAWQINEKLPLVAVARQESSASSAILGNPIPLFRRSILIENQTIAQQKIRRQING